MGLLRSPPVSFLAIDIGNTRLKWALFAQPVPGQAPVPGPEGRFLCGDMILPGAHVPAMGSGDVHPAAEWDGQLFHPVGLPAIFGPVQVLIAPPALEAQGRIRTQTLAGIAMKRSEVLRHETDGGQKDTGTEK